jgi:hypothetical protein
VSRINTDSSGDHNLTVGADGKLALGDKVSLDAYVAHSETPGDTSSSNAWNCERELHHEEMGSGPRAAPDRQRFNPEVGFLERPSFQYYNFRILRHLRTPNLAWFRKPGRTSRSASYDELTADRRAG